MEGKFKFFVATVAEGRRRHLEKMPAQAPNFNL